MGNSVSFLFIARDKYTRIAEKARRVTHKLSSGFGKLTKKLKTVRHETQKMGRTFTSTVKNMAGALIGFLGAREFLTVGMRFQDALADLSAITGATGEDLTKLQGTILRFAKESSTSADEVAQAFKLVASAKPELLENLDALAATTEQVLLLKNAAGIELASAAEIAAQSLNIFGVAADQANRFVNVLAAGAKLGSSEIADTGAALLIAGPAARAAGLSFEQLNAAIQATAKGGIKAQRAGTALNAIFGRLQRAGIDFQKLGLQDSFELVKKKMDSLKTSTERAQFAAKIFGEEHSKVGFALLDNVHDLSKYERTLAGTNIAQEQASIRLATFSAKMRRLGVLVQNAVIKTFLRLEPILTQQAERFAAFIEAIKPEHVTAFGDSLAALLDVAVILGEAFGIVLSVIKGIGTAVGELAAQITMGNFSTKLGTSFRDAFSFGGKFLGLFDNPEAVVPGQLNSTQSSRTDVNVNLRAPQGAIESVKSQTSGKVSGLNVGMNMVTAQ
jgi:TP901 family phage tail tape measure protein